MRDPNVPQGLQGDYQPVGRTSKTGEEEVIFMHAESDCCLTTPDELGLLATNKCLEAEFWQRAEACADYILKQVSTFTLPSDR